MRTGSGVACLLVLLDPDGTVRWLHTGTPADDPFQALATGVRELLASRP